METALLHHLPSLQTSPTDLLIWAQNEVLCIQYHFHTVNGMWCIWSCCRILDVWNISRPALIALGLDVKIGDVQPSCGKWTESQVECVVSEDLFPSKDSYRLLINSDRVCRGFYPYNIFKYCKI
jgi:hypothetical protein